MFTLIILPILAHLCLFLIISCQVMLLLFNCLYEVSLVVPLQPLCLVYILQTCPLFEFSFSSPTCHTQMFPIYSHYFYHQIFSGLCRTHLMVSLPFHIPHLSSSTGRLRPCSVLTSLTRRLHNILFKHVLTSFCLSYCTPNII